jgi:hypothetical protein
MQPHRLLGACAFSLLLTLAPAAHADEDVLSDTARELFVKGVKAYEQQKWDQCRAALLAAFAIKRHNQIAGNLGECEMKLGKYRDAADHAWFFAHTLRPDANPERRAGAEALLKEAQQKVGTVLVTVDVDGATVLVDGQPAGNAPLAAPVFVDPGKHTIEALHAGDPGARVTVDAGAGETREVTLAVRKKEAPPPPVPMVQKRPLWPALAAGSVAVVLLGVGTGLTVAGKGKQTDGAALLATLGTQPPCGGATSPTACQSIKNDGTTHDTLDKAALGTFVVGGALALATTGLAAWWATGPTDTASRRTSVRVVPMVGSGEGGVVITGAW